MIEHARIEVYIYIYSYTCQRLPIAPRKLNWHRVQ